MPKKDTAWKISRYGVFFGLYFSVFGLEKTPYLDTFQAMRTLYLVKKLCKKVPSQVAEKLKTWNLGKLENFLKTEWRHSETKNCY